MKNRFILILPILIPALLITACNNNEEAPAENYIDQFFNNLAEHCGNAYEGHLVVDRPGDDMLEGDELLIAHFRECSDDEIRIPFHIEIAEGEWDRSRTWIITHHTDSLEIRHDHRHEDGTEEENTMYGGFTHIAPDGNRHEFLYPPRTEEVGVPMGWRLEIEPGQRYTYGTMRDSEFTWRVDFDLSETTEAPPAPWGFDR